MLGLKYKTLYICPFYDLGFVLVLHFILNITFKIHASSRHHCSPYSLGQENWFMKDTQVFSCETVTEKVFYECISKQVGIKIKFSGEM
jgi:hypothetical protein